MLGRSFFYNVGHAAPGITPTPENTKFVPEPTSMVAPRDDNRHEHEHALLIRNNHEDTSDSRNDFLNTDSKQRACRVVISSKVDFHHEVIESVVLRFQLPWHKFNCTISKPIVYDFALYQNRFHLGQQPAVSGNPHARFLNETEFWSWKKYFEEDLQYKTFDRLDGTQTKAYFNSFVAYGESHNTPIDAMIDTTCDINNRF